MKTMLRLGSAVLLLTMIAPAASFARPIHAISHSRTNVIHDRSPHVQVRESILHHS